MKNSLTPILLIGSAKSGTTFLFDCLKQHPEICPSRPKEPEYFSSEKVEEIAFEDLFKLRKGHKYVLDGSTGYSKYPEKNGVPEKIKEYGFDPYIIYVVRNPVKRVESDINFMNRDKKRSYMSNFNVLINVSRYHTQLSRYEACFSHERIKVLKFEDLINSPQQICSDIFQFLGTNDFEITLDRSRKNPTKPLNRSLFKLGKRMRKLLRKRFTKITGPFQPSIYGLFGRKSIKLNEVQRQEIRSILKDEMIKLHHEYGVEIESWGFDPK